MKHNYNITAILIGMFIITQLIGLYVVSFYAPIKIVDGEQINVTSPKLPYGFEPPELRNTQEFSYAFASILFSFVVAVSLLLILTRLNAAFFLKLWFFLVIVASLGIALNAIFPDFSSKMIAVFLLSLPLAFFKVYKRNFFVHNSTELLIYPGVAAVFVPIMNIYTVSILLVLISIYDIWAVWHSGIMQKMAKYQINQLNIFSGFFIPYMSKSMKEKVKKMKASTTSASKSKKFKVNVAILGGGDVVFPIITSGVVLKTLGLLPALMVVLGATCGLGYLFLSSEKKKFYPAMPFISAGIFLGMFLGYILF